MDFCVFLHEQDHNLESAKHRGTRTVVALVIAAGLARRVGQNAVKLNVSDSWKEVKRSAREGRRLRTRFVYIPEKMPPRDVPGVVFQPPQSESWRLAHRTVTFMPREANAV